MLTNIPPEEYKKSILKFYGNESDDMHLVIGSNVQPEDIELMKTLFVTDQFGNVYDTEIFWLDLKSMADIYVMAGIFPSFTQARKNGKDTPIPAGYSEHKIGKKKRRVFIFNPIKEQ